MNRPFPEPGLLDSYTEQFAPAHEVLEWFQAAYLDEDGALYNPDHSHLLQAKLGFLWTTAPNTKSGRRILGMAELPNCQGKNWSHARQRWLLRRWFSDIPDFVITLDALWCAEEADDASFCALVDHEAYHCGVQTDDFGSPRYTRDGDPVFGMRAHDVEQFIGVVRRFGARAAHVEELVQAASRPPVIAEAQLQVACGTCLR